MPFTTEDKILIKHYRLDKKYGKRKIIHEFLNKPWSASGLHKLIKKIDNTGGTDRTNSSGRPKSVRTQDNIDDVSLRVLSQDGKPGTHDTAGQISKATGISKSSI